MTPGRDRGSDRSIRGQHRCAGRARYGSRRVTGSDESGGGFVLDTDAGTIRAREVVGATARVPPRPRIPETAPRPGDHASPSPCVTGTPPPYRPAACSWSEPGRPVQLAEEAPGRGAGSDALGGTLRAACRARYQRSRLFLVDPPTRPSTARHSARPLPTVDQLPDPRHAVRLQPAPRRSRGRARDEPAPVRPRTACASSGDIATPRTARSCGFRSDREENLTFADATFDQRFRPLFDAYRRRGRPRSIRRTIVSPSHPGFRRCASSTSRMRACTTVLWTTGYAPDYDCLDVPIERQFASRCARSRRHGGCRG
jgi:hypothetical protein